MKTKALSIDIATKYVKDITRSNLYCGSLLKHKPKRWDPAMKSEADARIRRGRIEMLFNPSTFSNFFPEKITSALEIEWLDLINNLFEKSKIGSFSLAAQGPINIFHLVLMVNKDILLFQRPCGTWSLLSGQIEKGETSILAASREALEEINMFISPDSIIQTDHNFTGITQKGNHFQCQSVWTNIDVFEPWRLNLNSDEIINWMLVPINKAFCILEKGFPETVEELVNYKKYGFLNS